MVMQRTILPLLISILITTAFMVPLVSTDTTATIYVNPSKNVSINKLQIGFQASYQAGNLNYRSDVVEIYKEMKPKIVRIFDWRPEVDELDPCNYWYESSKSGNFDWRSVDRAIDLIFDMGAEPLICLGTSGSSYPPSSYSQRYLPKGMTLKYNLLPDYRQFAAYCREWVEHFEETDRPVRYYEIWNEPWGYFDWGGEHTDRLDDWMDLWITCEREMHAENPDILIGSDHTIMRDVLEAFIRRDADLGFISYHKYDTGSSSTWDSTLFRTAETEKIDGTSTCYGAKGSQQRWLEAKQKLIPVMNSESCMNWDWSPTDPRLQKMSGAVWNALCLRKEILEGVSYHVYFDEYSYARWDRTPSGFGMVDWGREARRWYPYYVYYLIGNNLDVGDRIVETTTSSENMRVLSWHGDGKLNILIIHKAKGAETVRLTGVEGSFRYFKIDESIPYTNPSMQEGVLEASENILLDGYTVMLLQQDSEEQKRLFADDFESGNFDAWSGLTVTDVVYATVTGINTYYGEYAARFQVRSIVSGTGRACVHKTFDDRLTIYARGYFYIAEGLPLTDNDDRFTVLQFLGPEENIICNLQIRRVWGEDRFTILSGEDMQTTTDIYPANNEWYCLELYAKIHPTDGVVKAYINDIEALALYNLDTAIYGNINTVRFGLANSINTQQTVTLYGDCCILSTKYIGSLIPWDYNQDGIIDLRDVGIAHRAYNSTPELENWDVRVDFNHDGIIDMWDMSVLAAHYGEAYI